ncbi:hypothetical protein [Alteribacter natronophilus]|uniref:hypothetical protein n=1 Tax=Alteribacter natronophilus TaxID=2583810 RepID=UPI00110DE75C|nr:hypothetical protein [Alteribacter natronophilus]TMW71172.1 hypothetical protein FGB90_14515 [Alteribacter natronophilus]
MKEHLTILYIVMMVLASVIFMISLFSKAPKHSYNRTVTSFILAYVSEIILASAIISMIISFIFNNTFNYLPSDNHIETFAQSYAIYQILIIVILQVRNNQKKEAIYILKNNLEKVKLAVNLKRKSEAFQKLSGLSISAEKHSTSYKVMLPNDVYKEYTKLLALCENLKEVFESGSEDEINVIKDKVNFDIEKYLMDTETDIATSGLIWSSSLLLYFKKRGISLNISSKKYYGSKPPFNYRC